MDYDVKLKIEFFKEGGINHLWFLPLDFSQMDHYNMKPEQYNLDKPGTCNLLHYVDFNTKVMEDFLKFLDKNPDMLNSDNITYSIVPNKPTAAGFWASLREVMDEYQDDMIDNIVSYAMSDMLDQIRRDVKSELNRDIEKIKPAGIENTLMDALKEKLKARGMVKD
jgi:hypothetical protein